MTDMKYLKDYINEKQTELFERTNTIFAFSNKQFEEQQKEGVTYVNCGMGMLCDERYVVELMKGLDKIHKEGIEQDIAENGLEKIILRELRNHEAYYTREIDDTYESLKPYGVTEEQVWKMFKNKNARL
jgi:hypothetical protein